MDSSINKALQQAIGEGDPSLVKECLTQGGDPNGMGRHTTFLHTAILLGQTDVLKTLLKAGAAAERPDPDGVYPLHLAAHQGHTAMVNQLLRHGADLYQRTGSESTALHLAAAANRAATARALVQAGSDLEATDTEGNTPLLAAASLGNKGAVETLLKLGAQVNATNRGGQSALHLALWGLYSTAIGSWSHALRNGRTWVQYYLRRGGMYVVEDYNEHSPMTGRRLSLRAQREISLAPWGPTEHLSYLDALETVKILIKEGGALEQADDSGATPLYLACYVGEGAAIDALYKAGASRSTKPWRGTRELHQVASSQRLDGLEIFLKRYGADHINAADANGWTPAHYLGDAGGPIEMAFLLGDHGADPDQTTTEATDTFPAGITAARMAFHWQDLDLAMALDNMGQK